MDSTGWDHEPPAPNMPPEVIENTSALYREAYELLTGASLDDWYRPDDDVTGRSLRAAKLGPRRSRTPVAAMPVRRARSVEVTHRPGIADPAGATVERALPALGYTNVTQVHIGKVIRLVVEAADADARPGAGRGDVRAAPRESRDRVVRGLGFGPGSRE